MVQNAHISFVSGHASFTFQAMTFLSLYLQARLITHQSAEPSSFSLISMSIFDLIYACFLKKLFKKLKYFVIPFYNKYLQYSFPDLDLLFG